MISIDQIKTLSKKYQISDYVVAREYLQILFLKELYSESFSKDVYFKGGTAIRLIYGGTRFSEDLDFTSNSSGSLENCLVNLFSRLEKNYPVAFKERKSLAGKTYLITGEIRQINSPIYVKLDFSLRENAFEPEEHILKTDYPVMVQNFVRCLSLNEVLSEKISAVMRRKKHRDLYDLWVLFELGAKVDDELIKKKFEHFNEIYNNWKLIKELEKFDKAEFVRDLGPFIGEIERKNLGDLFDYINKYLLEVFYEKT